ARRDVAAAPTERIVTTAIRQIRRSVVWRHGQVILTIPRRTDGCGGRLVTNAVGQIRRYIPFRRGGVIWHILRRPDGDAGAAVGPYVHSVHPALYPRHRGYARLLSVGRRDLGAITGTAAVTLNAITLSSAGALAISATL